MPLVLGYVAAHGLHIVSSPDVGYLFNRGFAPDLLGSGWGGHVVRALPTWLQLEVLLLEMVPSAAPGPSPAHTAAQVAACLELLPGLDQKRTLRLAKFVDPGMARTGHVWAQEQREARGVLLELFFAAVCRLIFLAKQRAAKQQQQHPQFRGQAGKELRAERTYTQRGLEKALSRFWTQYRLSQAVKICLDWGNWAGAAAAYRAAGQRADAFELSLIACMQQLHAGSGSGSGSESEAIRARVQEEVCALVSDKEALAGVPSATERARLLALVISYWRHAHFPMAPLEAALLGAVGHLWEPLAVLLFQTHSRSGLMWERPPTQLPPDLSPPPPLPLSALLAPAAAAGGGGGEGAAWPFVSARIQLAVTLQMLHQAQKSPSAATLARLGQIGRGGLMSGRLLQANAAAINRLWSTVSTL